jgi:hypothetical protein
MRCQLSFEQAGHKRFQARVENNVGFLFATHWKIRRSPPTPKRARSLHLSVGDHGGAAGAEDTRAQAFYLRESMKKRNELLVVRSKHLKRGGEQTVLAEALTTHAKALARLNQTQVAKTVGSSC